MIMIAEMNFSTARKEFTSVIDRVQGYMPIAILPRKASEEHTILLKDAMLKDILLQLKFDLQLRDETEDAYTYWLDSFNMYGYGETKEEALNSLVEDILLYVEEYYENPILFYNTPNRRAHIPFILKVSLLCSNPEDVKRMLLRDAS
ncbi:hypothetical protein HQN89_14430 [Paenibacillus frigoriresistens]|uniref:hypothetical protein n=1 Tax=Paenibacillus alginolyticus TaxID=59839 RepID=UPI001567536D|nr:hypothetical protein [Paenibacillus frigoriresistens]NRF92205.1 hypothetical protein [Paenibacillus frigoriresistens]